MLLLKKSLLDGNAGTEAPRKSSRKRQVSGRNPTIDACSLLAAGEEKHPAVEGEKAAWEQGDSDTVVVPLH